jgi:hypothetical protein
VIDNLPSEPICSAQVCLGAQRNMFSKTAQRRATLFLLVFYSLDLVWKLFHWHELSSGVPWWGIAVGLTVRFAFMWFMIAVYLRMRKPGNGFSNEHSMGKTFPPRRD